MLPNYLLRETIEHAMMTLRNWKNGIPIELLGVAAFVTLYGEENERQEAQAIRLLLVKVIAPCH